MGETRAEEEPPPPTTAFTANDTAASPPKPKVSSQPDATGELLATTASMATLAVTSVSCAPKARAASPRAKEVEVARWAVAGGPTVEDLSHRCRFIPRTPAPPLLLPQPSARDPTGATGASPVAAFAAPPLEVAFITSAATPPLEVLKTH